MKLYNTLGRSVESFEPIKPGQVKMYSCGPTVYDYQHLGNYSGYIYWDVLARLLKSQGYEVKRVMNITDVGHLDSDADEGEDKLEKGAKREGKTARQVADFYTTDFLKSMELLNLEPPDEYAEATDFIDQQIAMVKILSDRGFAYQTKQAIYFDVTKLDDYGKLTGQKLSEKEVGARSDVVTDSAKHHPQDFALWFFTVGRFADHEMHWPSPWGDGFPGWHLECSAIIHATLGDPIDIHTGGVDHIGTHHTNEIAQTKAAFGHKLANFWLHNNHMMVDGKKISKSLGNGLTLKDLADKGYSPMDFKMLVLQSHYRSQSNFTWEALAVAKLRLTKYYSFSDLQFQTSDIRTASSDSFIRSFNAVVEDLCEDLNSTKALINLDVLADITLEDGLSSANLINHKEYLSKIDMLLGLDLSNREDVANDLKKLIAEREEARKTENWDKSDELRDQLAGNGIGIRDTEHGPIWHRL